MNLARFIDEWDISDRVIAHKARQIWDYLETEPEYEYSGGRQVALNKILPWADETGGSDRTCIAMEAIVDAHEDLARDVLDAYKRDGGLRWTEWKQEWSADRPTEGVIIPANYYLRTESLGNVPESIKKRVDLSLMRSDGPNQLPESTETAEEDEDDPVVEAGDEKDGFDEEAFLAALEAEEAKMAAETDVKAVETDDPEVFVRPSVGQGGKYTFSTGYGPTEVWTFDVVRVNKSGKTIDIRIDDSGDWASGQKITLTWRKDCWRQKGMSARESRSESYSIGSKHYVRDPQLDYPR